MRWLLIIAVVVSLVACASAPVQEMSDARQALDAAHDAKADRLMPSAYREAVGYLNDASRMLYFGQYDYARQQALKAGEKAQVLRELAAGLQAAMQVVSKVKIRDERWNEAHNLLRTARKAAAEGWLDEARQLIEYALRRINSD